jgi:hypothetical protein
VSGGTFDIEPLMDYVASTAMASGYFTVVNKHEAVGNIGTYVASVWLQHIGPARGGSGLNATSLRVELTLRIYSAMITAPSDEIDPNMARAAMAVLTSFSGAFSIGDTVRDIDLLGEFGTPLSGKAGYLNLSTQVYRVMDITIPIIVDDVLSQAA